MIRISDYSHCYNSCTDWCSSASHNLTHFSQCNFPCRGHYWHINYVVCLLTFSNYFYTRAPQNFRFNLPDVFIKESSVSGTLIQYGLANILGLDTSLSMIIWNPTVGQVGVTRRETILQDVISLSFYYVSLGSAQLASQINWPKHLQSSPVVPEHLQPSPEDPWNSPSLLVYIEM